MADIIIVTDFWLPSVNGVTRMLQQHVRFLKGKGLSVLVVHPGMFRSLSAFFYPDVKIAMFASKKMARIFAAENPKYVFIATEGTLGVAARAYCLQHNLRFISSYQGNIPYYVQHYTKLKSEMVFDTVYAYFAWFHKESSAVLVATKSLQEELTGRGFDNLVYCPLGVDTDFFKKEMFAAGPKKMPRPVFVYFGRVAKEKNIEEFLQCKLPGTKLVIGDGPMRKALEKKYPEAKFVGWKKEKDLVRWISGCDVFVFPSVTETFGLVIIEALACGLPVAAHNVMGPKDIIDNGVDGYLDDDLAKAAMACLHISQDACRNKALQFSAQTSSQQFLDILRNHPAQP